MLKLPQFPVLMFVLLLLWCCGCIQFMEAASASKPKALVAPIVYDPITDLFSVVGMAGRPFDRPLLLSLDSSIVWLDCIHPPYKSSSSTSPSSSSLQPVLYRSAVCNAANVRSSLISGSGGKDECFNPPSLICTNTSCTAWISGSYSSSPNSVLWTDTVSGLVSTDGRSSTTGGPVVRVPKFAFACAGDVLTEPQNSVPTGAVGAASLSRAALALPAQLSAKLSMKRKFAYCLPRPRRGGTTTTTATTGKGALFFGDSPYSFLPGLDFSSALLYTPLLTNPREPDSYYIGVKAVSVDSTKLPVPESRFKLRNDPNIRIGNQVAVVRGTMVSSTVRYTTLNSSIFDLLLDAFKLGAKARGLKEVAPISPFEACYDASSAIDTRVGYAVPFITFTLQGSGQNSVNWPFYGANTVVSVNDDKAICLAFLRANPFEQRSIILGTFQQGDALLQFDLATSRLGFVPTLLASRLTSCSNFNFTSN